MTHKIFYRGMSTADWKRRRSFRLTNVDIVKQDLLNHIFTEKGERVMMPDFGTRIPTMAFEPNDERSRKIIEHDLKEVFDYDPRVEIIALDVISLPDNGTIVAVADLLYVELNITDVLRIEVKTLT